MISEDDLKQQLIKLEKLTGKNYILAKRPGLYALYKIDANQGINSVQELGVFDIEYMMTFIYGLVLGAQTKRINKYLAKHVFYEGLTKSV